MIIKIPVEALEINEACPEKGDEVEVSIAGEVVGLSGDYAQVRVTAIDGVEYEDRSEGSEGPGSVTLDEERNQIRNQMRR